MSAVVALILLTVTLFIGWKARRAHRSLWSALETQRKKWIVETRLDRKRWQRCYGRLVALNAGKITPFQLTAQHAEDVFLVDYFEGLPSGIFVEVGAYDGVQCSNTYALEQLGWSGLLVEAHPQNVEKCRKNRPTAIVEHAAVGGPEATGSVAFNEVKGKGADLLSFISADEQHLARCRHEGEGICVVQVPYASLAALFKKNGLNKIDFLSIDIEGAEIEALRGINLTQTRPHLILLEANHEQAAKKLKEFLEPQGYRQICRFDANLLFQDERAGHVHSYGACI